MFLEQMENNGAPVRYWHLEHRHEERFGPFPLTATYAACSPRGREPGAAVPSWKLHWQWVFPKKNKQKESNGNFIFTSLLLCDTNLSGPVSVLSLGSPCVGGC